jgi:hypothetical protein
MALNGSPTEKISQFVDHFVNPSIQKIKSYVKDTTHFLCLLEEVGDRGQHTCHHEHYVNIHQHL